MKDLGLDPILNSMKDGSKNSWVWLSVSGLLTELAKYTGIRFYFENDIYIRYL